MQVGTSLPWQIRANRCSRFSLERFAFTRSREEEVVTAAGMPWASRASKSSRIPGLASTPFSAMYSSMSRMRSARMAA